MKFSDVINDLESLSTEGIYTRGKIAWWLIKYEENYKELNRIKYTLEAEFSNRKLRTQKLFIKELLFIELYEGLYEIFENYPPNNNKGIDLNGILNRIKASTNGLDRKDENFTWSQNSNYNN